MPKALQLVKNSRLKPGNSLAVQWLGFCILTIEGTGSISNLGTKIQQKRLQQVQKGMRRVRERDLYTDNLGGRGRSRELQKHVWGGKNGREGLMAALEDKQRKNFGATESTFRAGHTLEWMVWIKSSKVVQRE